LANLLLHIDALTILWGDDLLSGLLKYVIRPEMPKVETYFHNLILRDICTLDQVIETLFSVSLEDFNILIGLHSIGCTFYQSQILHQNIGDCQSNIFAEVFKVALVLATLQCLELISQISIFGDILDLFNEQAVVHARFLLV
jgi:hypothetical protein